jgi:hypothetical protein
MTRRFPLAAFVAGSLLLITPHHAGRAHAETSRGSFLPTWKLLSTEQKQQFIAGYIQGWRDAARVTDIAIGYVRTNPEKALDGLEGVKQLYDLSGVKPTQLAQEVDAFYADPENGGAPLSLAITSAKRRLQE